MKRLEPNGLSMPCLHIGRDGWICTTIMLAPRASAVNHARPHPNLLVHRLYILYMPTSLPAPEFAFTITAHPLQFVNPMCWPAKSTPDCLECPKKITLLSRHQPPVFLALFIIMDAQVNTESSSFPHFTLYPNLSFVPFNNPTDYS